MFPTPTAVVALMSCNSCVITMGVVSASRKQRTEAFSEPGVDDDEVGIIHVPETVQNLARFPAELGELSPAGRALKPLASLKLDELPG